VDKESHDSPHTSDSAQSKSPSVVGSTRSDTHVNEYGETLEQWLDRMDATYGKKVKKLPPFHEHAPEAHSTQEKQHECAKVFCGKEPD
jgi:Tfp pilus assembly protein PilP